MKCIHIVVIAYTLAIAAPARAAQGTSNLTVRIVPSQTLKLNWTTLQLTHNSGTDLKITAECAPSPAAGSASLLLRLAGATPAKTLCGGGSAQVQDLYTQLPAGTLNGAFAYTAQAGVRDAVAFTVTYTSVEQ